MNELVQSKFHKLLSALRPPNFSGGSMVSRMRSTTFVLLGLMTATGLALVAIFATPQLHLLSPAPLPSEPTTSISKAEKLSAGHGPKVLAPAGAAGSKQSVRSGAVSHVNGGGGSTSGRGGHYRGVGALGSPQTVSSPSHGGGAGGGGGQPEATPTPVPAPAEPSPAPESVPVASPAPEKGSSGHSSSPNPTPATPTPSHAGVSDSHGSHQGAREAEGSAGHSAGTSEGHTSAGPTSHPAAPAPPGSPGHSSSSGSHDHSR